MTPMTSASSTVPPPEEIIERILAVAETEEPGTPEAIDHTFHTVGMPEAPTLRELLLRSRSLRFPKNEMKVWGLGDTDNDGYDLITFCDLYPECIPIVDIQYAWHREKQVWCHWNHTFDEFFEFYPDDATMLHAAFTHLAAGY